MAQLTESSTDASSTKSEEQPKKRRVLTIEQLLQEDPKLEGRLEEIPGVWKRGEPVPSDEELRRRVRSAMFPSRWPPKGTPEYEAKTEALARELEKNDGVE